jgi:hypothetical protein
VQHITTRTEVAELERVDDVPAIGQGKRLERDAIEITIRCQIDARAGAENRHQWIPQLLP